jgi:hypothetical protein
MRWLLRLSALLAVVLLLPAAISTHAKSEAGSTISPLPADAPACASTCAKSGVNTAWPVLIPEDDYSKYPRAQRVGMGWMLELVLDSGDVTRAVEAANWAQDHDLQFMVIPNCEDETCPFIDVNSYIAFLSEIDSHVDGEFWAMAGPNEPEFWGDWLGGPWQRPDGGFAGSDPAQVAAYMNTLIAARDQDFSYLRLTSPGFNLSNPDTLNFYNWMVDAGANFGALDAFAGTSYTGGMGAYFYYTTFMRGIVEGHGKQFIFVEFGSDQLNGKPIGDPSRIPVIEHMQSEFRQAADDPTVMAILHFNAFGNNPAFLRFELTDAEIAFITQGNTCTGSSHNEAGIGIEGYTSETLWMLTGQTSCQEFTYGCPYKDGGATVCQPGVCVDNDSDGFYGEGNGCIRNDCNDADPLSGLNCGGGVPDVETDWGTIKTIEHLGSTNAGWLWPSLQIRANGQPIVAYHNDSLRQGELNVLDCTSLDCSIELRRDLTYTNHQVGTYLSMLLKADGNPLIAHLDQTYAELEIFNCTDPGCVAGASQIIDPDTGVWDFGYATSIALRNNNGRPIIAYWHNNTTDLRLIDCANGDCTSGWIRTLDNLPMTGYWPSVVIGADSNPLIAYAGFGFDDIQQWQLGLFDCADSGCETGERRTLDAENAWSFWPHAMTLRSNDLPLIVYRRLNANSLMLYECHTTDCATGTPHELYTGAGIVESASIVLLEGDNPFIAFAVNNSGNYDLMMIRCDDPSCNQKAMASYTDGSAGAQPDVAIRPNGNPLIAFHDVGNSDVMLYDVTFGVPPTRTETPTETETATATETETATATETTTATETATVTETSTPNPSTTPEPSQTSEPSETPEPSQTPEPETCNSFPLTFYEGAAADNGSGRTLANSQLGDKFAVGLGAGSDNRYTTVQWNDSDPGGAEFDPPTTLGRSLGWPEILAGREPVGNSTDPVYGFVNARDGNDHTINVGDWVMRGPVSIGVGTDPGKAIADHIANSRMLRVLVFDREEDNIYRISNIILVKIVEFHDRGSNMTVEFVSYDSNCGR